MYLYLEISAGSIQWAGKSVENLVKRGCGSTACQGYGRNTANPTRGDAIGGMKLGYRDSTRIRNIFAIWLYNKTRSRRNKIINIIRRECVAKGRNWWKYQFIPLKSSSLDIYIPGPGSPLMLNDYSNRWNGCEWVWMWNQRSVVHPLVLLSLERWQSQLVVFANLRVATDGLGLWKGEGERKKEQHLQCELFKTKSV